ncbi:lymphotoxin-beta [Myotis lucifugus]|uniref:lymphotoxin-beta n=1 Tax=Myotis lucifugus TaxID=59463 RepID=UPI000CCC5621|nr:lymphotoxin-beta [Myotis lucifugus]
MGALGLEGWGRRRQGKGCLLLAVAGTTSLVTLLLAVPLTVLAVLVVAPQKQGLVAETTDPGAQARAQQRLGKSRLSPSRSSPRDSSPHPSAAPDTLLFLRESLGPWHRAGGAYGRGAPELLLEGAETVRPALDAPGRLWYASVGFGGLARLRRGERVFVNISHPALVDSRRGKTFFGAVMVG